jgi:NADPH-dependent curcumin reductase CurA
MFRRSLPSLARNLQIRLASRPVGAPAAENFTIVRDAPVPTPGDGELLLRNIYLSLDPAMRGWMSDAKSYIPPIPINDVMRGGCVAEVMESNGNPRFKQGDVVVAMSGWCEYAVSDGKGLTPVPP